MKYIFLFLISQSVLLPIIAGLIRFRRLERAYRPFLSLLFIGFAVEIISFILMNCKKSNAIPVNIYYLIEWTLLAWQFHTWGFMRQKEKAFYGLLGLGAAIWVIEYLLCWKINTFSPYFLFFYSFVLVLLSVNEINFMITHYNRNLFRNPKFLICIGFIIYFVYTIVDNWAFEISKTGKSAISVTISFWVAYVNALANIIYAVAFILIPTPQKFTLENDLPEMGKKP